MKFGGSDLLAARRTIDGFLWRTNGISGISATEYDKLLRPRGKLSVKGAIGQLIIAKAAQPKDNAYIVGGRFTNEDGIVARSTAWISTDADRKGVENANSAKLIYREPTTRLRPTEYSVTFFDPTAWLITERLRKSRVFEPTWERRISGRNPYGADGDTVTGITVIQRALTGFVEYLDCTHGGVRIIETSDQRPAEVIPLFQQPDQTGTE